MKVLVVALLLASTLAGCTSPAYGAGTVPSLTWDKNGSITVEEDQYIQFGFILNSGGRYDFSAQVQSGPNVDLFLMDSLNFQQYQNGNAFSYFASCSRSPMNSGSGTCQLDARQYYIVIDNSDVGNASPPWNGVSDTAFVNYDFKVYV
jgi:hypothetical protein